MASVSANTTAATGLEGSVVAISKNIQTYKAKITELMEGKHNLSGSSYSSASFYDKALDQGVIYVLDQISSLDICSILSYALQSLVPTSSFDPNKPPQNPTPLQSKLYLIKNDAYQVQTKIDDFYAQYGDSVTQGSNYAFINLALSIYPSIQGLISKSQDPVLIKSYKILPLFANFLAQVNNEIQNLPIDSAQQFQLSLNFNSGVNPSVLKIKSYIDKVRATCVSVLNFPDNLNQLQSLALAGISPILSNQIDQLSKLVDIKKLSPLISSLLSACNSLLQALSIIEISIRFAQLFVSIASILIKIFTIIVNFLEALPIPGMFSTVGVSVKFSDIAKKIKDLTNTYSDRLDQISRLLSSIVDFVDYVIPYLEKIVQDLSLIKNNLDNCGNVNSGLLDTVNNTIDKANSVKQSLSDFNQNYRDKSSQKNNSVGKYTLSILTEQNADPSVKLHRRYGVALDPDGFVAAETDPTFASLDSIIYEELKLKLASKGLIQNQALLPSNQQQILSEALNYLQDTSIVDALPINNFDATVDPPDNENENDGLGLNAFINKLKGGKRLRKRVRNAMNNSKNTLRSNLASVNK